MALFYENYLNNKKAPGAMAPGLLFLSCLGFFRPRQLPFVSGGRTGGSDGDESGGVC